MWKYKKILKIDSLEDYLEGDPDPIEDLRRFVRVIDSDLSPKTVISYTTAVKVFLQDHKVVIPRVEWKKLRRRGYIPKDHPLTRDRKPTQEQLRKVVECMSIRGRAVILFWLLVGVV